MPWELRIDPAVLKQLKRIPKNYAERIFEVIRSFAINPYAGDIEKMKGEDSVDSARKVITVFDVRRRTSSTY